MTQRTELQHRLAEFQSRMMSRVANRLFSFRQTGLDGFLKRRILKPHQQGSKVETD